MLESIEELPVKVQTLKSELLVNLGKTKILVSGNNLDGLKNCEKDPCGVRQE